MGWFILPYDLVCLTATGAIVWMVWARLTGFNPQQYIMKHAQGIYAFLSCSRVRGFIVAVHYIESVLIQALHPANEKRRYKVTLSLVGSAQTQN